MSVDLTGLWSTNRRWRAWMDQHTSFKTPDTLDCLRYALIESCEALDAFLRAKNPTHARNNGREHTVESELADTAMLLLTVLPDALVINGPLPTFRALGDGKLLDEICRLIPNAIFYHECDDDEERRVVWRLIATVTLYYIVAYPGLDLPAELDRCWRRLAWKHGGLALEKWLLATGIETARVNGLIVCASGWKEEILPMPWLVEEQSS